MRSRDQRDRGRALEILDAIAEDGLLTQRALAARLGIALGLTNLYLKRLARKGFIKIREFPTKPAARKRLRYLLTAKGLAEKTRLTFDHIVYWAAMYGRVRRALRQGLEPFLARGLRRIALFGTDEAAELAYLTLREFRLEPVGVFDRRSGGVFLGYPVRDVREVLETDIDGIVLATFDRPDAWIAELTAMGFTSGQLIALRPPAGRVATAAGKDAS